MINTCAEHVSLLLDAPRIMGPSQHSRFSDPAWR